LSNSPIISIQNLTVGYKNQSVLENLSLDINAGEFIAIIGKSGTGKTTLLNSIAGFIKHDGVIEIPNSIGFCFQNNSLFYWMTVKENIAFGLNDFNEVEKNEIINDILLQIDMVKYQDKYPNELSGGQQQRVALGRALANNPKILLLDEPFSSLDIHTRDQMMVWVLNILSKINITIIMVTHYLDEAIILANKVIVLKNKNILTEVIVPFDKPRSQSIRYTEKFQNMKQELALLLNSN
jgi:ABC-type nitrate/sulfonate/bicarbonate transport system ATPase subunit